MSRFLSLSLSLVVSATLLACSKNEPAPAATPSAAAASAANPHPTQGLSSAARAPASESNSGKVLQVLQGGGYTYAEVASASGQPVWIAGSQINIKAGDTLEWGAYNVMRNFTARSLGRTFEEILFVSQWGPAGLAQVVTAPHGSLPPLTPTLVPPGGAGGGDKGVVKSVSNAGGYSYIEVESGAGTVWLAATEVNVKAGDKIQWQGATTMSNFTAKALNRTFERIIFASSVTSAP